MRRPLSVVVIATLLLPSVVAARLQDRDNKDAAHVADPPAAAPAATPGKHAPQSLLGMVMGALIQSAEQQSKSKQATSRRDPGKAKPAAAGADPRTQTDVADEQIAVQSEP
jgi:hypothetical protein